MQAPSLHAGSSTPQSSSTPTIPATASVVGATSMHKVSIDQVVPADPGWEGALVVWHGERGQFELLSLPRMISVPLPGGAVVLEEEAIFNVSPDRAELAYIEHMSEAHDELRIVRGDGIEQAVPNWPSGRLWSIIRWLDNHRLALAEFDHRDGTVFVYETVQGEMAELGPFFPNVTENGKLPMEDPYVYYDSSLTRLVIVRYLASAPPKLNYELRDATTMTLLWEGSGTLASSARPAWSPDSDKFAISLAPYPPPDDDYCNKLFLVGHDGEQRELDGCASGPSSWSPDGQRLAAWHVQLDDSCPYGGRSDKLLVLEVDTGNRDIYALCPEPGEGAIFYGQYPIWSPDGRFIAFNLYDVHAVPVGGVILDLVQIEAYRVPAINEIRGWMQSLP